MNGDVAWMPGTRLPVTAVGDVAEGKMAVFADATGRKVRAQDAPTPQPVSHFVEAIYKTGDFGPGFYLDCSEWRNGERYLVGARRQGAPLTTVVFNFTNIPEGVFSFGIDIVSSHSTIVFAAIVDGSQQVVSSVANQGSFFEGMLSYNSRSRSGLDGVVKAFA